MKIRKRMRNLLLAVLMLLLGISGGGCGSQDKAVKLDPDNPVTIELWHYYNGAQKKAFDALVSEFNETVGLEKGIIITSSGQGSIPDLTAKVLDAANHKVGAEEIPGIFAAYADTAWEIDQMGLVADLGQYLTDKELDEYVDSYIEEGRMGEDNSLKIFPTVKSTEIFLLNRTDWDKFAEAAGASLDSLSTVEGLVDTAEKYYEWTDSLTPGIPDDGKAFFGRDAMANYFIIGGKQLGMEIFTVKDGIVNLQLDKDVIRKLWDNYYVPYINGWFTANGRFRSDDAKTGDLIALIGSSSSASYFPDTVKSSSGSYPIESLMMEAPCFKDGEHYAVQQGAGMVVSKSTPEEEYAATVFLKWFTDTERNLDFSIRSGYLPVKKAANDLELLDKNIATAEEQEEMTDGLKISLPVAIETVNSHKLYTNRAFKNGTEARNVLETALSDQAKADRKEVLALMSAGMSRRDAVAQFDTDENFDRWYDGFCSALKTTVNQ